MVNKKIIDLFIAGTQKAGTSSLREYLARHPNAITHHTNELPYFTFDREYNLGFETTWDSYFLPLTKPAGQRVVAKNVMVMYSETGLRRLYEHNPHGHIVILLRNPVSRAYSAYWYARRREEQGQGEPTAAIQSSVSSRDFSLLERFNTAYLELGKYIHYLRLVIKIFSPPQVHIYTVEDLKTDTQKICDELFDVMGLSPLKIELNFKANIAARPRYPVLAKLLYGNGIVKKLMTSFIPHPLHIWMRKTKIKIARWNDVTFEYPPMSANLKQWLIDFYLPYNKELETFLGRDLSHWNQ